MTTNPQLDAVSQNGVLAPDSTPQPCPASNGKHLVVVADSKVGTREYLCAQCHGRPVLIMRPWEEPVRQVQARQRETTA